MPGTSASKKSASSGTAVLAIVTAGVLLAGCASKSSAAGSGGKPPKLLIGTGTSAGLDAAPMIAAAGVPAKGGAAVAPVPIGGFGGFGGYVISGTLPTQPTHAPIYTWQAGKASQADVTKLAAALGLTGTPTRHTYGWELTTSTGDLRVRDGDGEAWSYNSTVSVQCPTYQTDIDNADGASVGIGCAVSAPPPIATPATPGATTPATPVTPVTPVAPVQGPDETATKAAAASLLSALGVTGTEEFNASSPASTLTVSPQIDGMPTQGIETNVDVDAQGIRAATGYLVAPKSGTDYPLQTAAAAFKSLADRPVPAIAMYCGPNPGGPMLPVTSGNEKSPLTPSASAVPAPGSAGPNVFFPLNPSASASPNTGWVGSPPALVSGPAVDSAAPASPPNVVSSAYACPTPKPQKVTGAVIGLGVQYDATGATTAADGSTSGGSNIMVPTWFFTVEGSTDPLTVIAVDPSFLGDQAPIPPVGAATSGGFEGSGGGASANSGTVAVPPSGPVLPPVPATKS